MKEDAIVVEQVIKAPLERVWRAISEREEIRHWFFDVSRFWPELGCDFQFYEYIDHKRYTHLCRVTEVKDRKKLAYTWRYEGVKGSSLVTFELVPADKETKLVLTHQGTKHFQHAGESFSRQYFISLWKRLITSSLKSYAEREILNKSVPVHADPATVWKILTDPEWNSIWLNSFKKGMTVESDWQEGSEVMWKDADGEIVTRGIVTVNNPENYLKICYLCDGEDVCSFNPGEEYQIYMLTGVSTNQTLLEVECNSYADHTDQLCMWWENALKKIRSSAEKETQRIDITL